jgi:hypothetical protein
MDTRQKVIERSTEGACHLDLHALSNLPDTAAEESKEGQQKLSHLSPSYDSSLLMGAITPQTAT